VTPFLGKLLHEFQANFPWKSANPQCLISCGGGGLQAEGELTGEKTIKRLIVLFES
jgi:hypothetical protein